MDRGSGCGRMTDPQSVESSKHSGRDSTCSLL
jgi:hypothetical protein